MQITFSDYLTKIKKYIFLIAIVIIIILIFFIISRNPFAKAYRIADIAYDVNKKFGYTVYIKENEEYTPYLVLTDRYGKDKSVLLLRQYVMDEYRAYQDAQGLPDYPTSDIDKYLNTEYLALFEPEFREKMLTTTVTVIPNVWDGNHKKGDPVLVDIERKAFLLAIEEMAFKNDYAELMTDAEGNAVHEGVSLKYAEDMRKDRVDRLAYRKGESKPSDWWLRTPCPTGLSTRQAQLFTGSCTTALTNNLHGVRPAFCVEGTMEIVKSDKIITGKEVYVFK